MDRIPSSSPPTHTSARQKRWTLRHVAHVIGLALLGYLFLSAALPPLLRWIAPFSSLFGTNRTWLVTLNQELLSTLSYAGSLLLPFWTMWRLLSLQSHRYTASQRPDLPYLLAAVFTGMGAASLGNLCSYGLTSLFRRLGVGFGHNLPQFTDDFSANVVVVLCSTLVAAFVEEVAFRGVLVRALRPWGNGFAIGVSALLFALCHPSLPQFFPALLSGLALALFVVRTGGLWISIVVHMSYNALALLLNLASQQFLPAAQQLFSLVAAATLVLSGGVFGCYLLVRRHRDPRQAVPASPPAKGRMAAFLGSLPLWAALALLGWRLWRSIIFLAI